MQINRKRIFKLFVLIIGILSVGWATGCANQSEENQTHTLPPPGVRTSQPIETANIAPTEASIIELDPAGEEASPFEVVEPAYEFGTESHRMDFHHEIDRVSGFLAAEAFETISVW